jgi:tetratricopeptide (TPR) repeat protein
MATWLRKKSSAKMAPVMADHAHWLSRVGRSGEALSEYDLALQRDPFPPSWYWAARAIALFALGRYEEAIQSIRRMDRLYFWDYSILAGCFARLDRTAEARTAALESAEDEARSYYSCDDAPGAVEESC